MSDAIVAAFNDAMTWHEALAAIKGNTSALLDATRLGKLDLLPNDGEHEQAIGLGVIEIKTLFGSFTSIDEIKAVVGRQIDVEHAKHEFVVTIGNANTVDDMRLAFEQAQRLYDDRQSLIQEWSSNDDPVIKARAAQLDADAYTVVLRNLVSHLNDGNYLEVLGEKMLAAREENGPFNDIGALVAALDNAARAIDSDIVVTSFNAAADWEAMLAAVKDNASALLDSDHLAKLNTLPDDGIHEQAVGSGLAEIRTLFGDFISADQIKAAVEKQIDIEHGRFSALLAINDADNVTSMATVLSHHIAVLNQHRQDLIAQWTSSGDPDAVARAAELGGEVYTRVLNEIVSHLDNVPYQSELAARLLAARQNGHFSDIDAFITALDAADEAIDATHDAVISGTDSGFMSEDDLESVGGALIIEDGDWGESNFKLVPAADLQKQYGTFSFNSVTGQWTFTLNGNAQSLKQDQQVQQILLVESFDGTATRTITVTICGRNDAPVAAVDGNSVSGMEDTTIAGQVPAGADVDGDSLTYALVQPFDGLTFHEDGTFSFEPAVNFRGNITFQYHVVDENGGRSQPQTFTIKVGGVNDAPHDILLSNSHVEENAKAGAVVGTLTGLDIDGDTLTFSLLDNAGDRFAISNGQLVVQERGQARLRAGGHTYRHVRNHRLIPGVLHQDLRDRRGQRHEREHRRLVRIGPPHRGFRPRRDQGRKRRRYHSWQRWQRHDLGRAWHRSASRRLGKDTSCSTPRRTRHEQGQDPRLQGQGRHDLARQRGLHQARQERHRDQAGAAEEGVLHHRRKAKDKNDYVIYNNKKGVLSYDADGSGKGKAVEIATLSKNLKMTYKDFFVI